MHRAVPKPRQTLTSTTKNLQTLTIPFRVSFQQYSSTSVQSLNALHISTVAQLLFSSWNNQQSGCCWWLQIHKQRLSSSQYKRLHIQEEFCPMNLRRHIHEVSFVSCELLVFCEMCCHVLDSSCLSFCSNGLLQTQEDSAWFPHQRHNPGDYHLCPPHSDKAQASTQGSCHWPCLQLVLCHAPPFLLLVLCKSMSLHMESCSALSMLSSETVCPAIPQAQRMSSAVQQNTVALALLPATKTPRDSVWCWQPHHNGKKRQESRLQA